MNKLQYLRHYTLQKFGNDLLMTFIRNNGTISVFAYRKPKRTDYSSQHRTSCKKSVASSLFKRAHSIITNKDGKPNKTLE